VSRLRFLSAKKMSLKNRGAKEGNHRLQDSRLFGIMDDTVVGNKAAGPREGDSVLLSHKARKRALAVLLEAECRKAQAITLLNRNSCR